MTLVYFIDEYDFANDDLDIRFEEKVEIVISVCSLFHPPSHWAIMSNNWYEIQPSSQPLQVWRRSLDTMDEQIGCSMNEVTKVALKKIERKVLDKLKKSSENDEL